MDRQNFLNAFQFQQQTTVYEDIKAQRFLEGDAFVFDFNQLLIHKRQISKAQFTHHAFFVDAFDQSGPLFSMHFNGGTDGLPAQFIRF